MVRCVRALSRRRRRRGGPSLRLEILRTRWTMKVSHCRDGAGRERRTRVRPLKRVTRQIINIRRQELFHDYWGNTMRIFYRSVCLDRGESRLGKLDLKL